MDHPTTFVVDLYLDPAPRTGRAESSAPSQPTRRFALEGPIPCRHETDRFACALAAARVAHRARLSPTLGSELALVTSELASNAARHGGGGNVLVRTTGRGVLIICRDAGPGIVDVDQALQDGWSQGRRIAEAAPPPGGLGSGLGAVRRLTDALGFYRSDAGFTVVAYRDAACEREAHDAQP
jgi:serine/threonine-protein kinase RsbT